MTLVVAASLEVSMALITFLISGASNRFKQYPNYGNYVPQNYFCAFVSGFPQLWSLPHLWHLEHVPWESFLPLVRAFNRKRGELIRMNYLLMFQISHTNLGNQSRLVQCSKMVLRQWLESLSIKMSWRGWQHNGEKICPARIHPPKEGANHGSCH